MRVLIIDDDETFCRLLVEILEGWGAHAISTTNGIAGFEMMNRDEYDLCIIDVRMPLILGTEVADAIRQDHPQAKIILASAFADESLHEFARRQGIFLLSKPFTAKGLLDTVERALGEPIHHD